MMITIVVEGTLNFQTLGIIQRRCITSSSRLNSKSLKSSSCVILSALSQKDPSRGDRGSSQGSDHGKNNNGGNGSSQNNESLRFVNGNGETSGQGAIPFINVSSIVEEEHGNGIVGAVVYSHGHTFAVEEEIQGGDFGDAGHSPVSLVSARVILRHQCGYPGGVNGSGVDYERPLEEEIDILNLELNTGNTSEGSTAVGVACGISVT